MFIHNAAASSPSWLCVIGRESTLFFLPPSTVISKIAHCGHQRTHLITAFKELLRQDHCEIALNGFSNIRSECNPELGVYADLVTGLRKKSLTEEIDGLVHELDRIEWDDNKGLVKLVRALITAERAESTVRIFWLMKRSGWGSDFEMDEYLAKVLIKGLRSFGEDQLANEIHEELRRLYKGVVLEKSII